MSESLDRALDQAGIQEIERGLSADGTEVVLAPVDAIPALVSTLLDAGFNRFVDLTAVDEPSRPDRFELQYCFHSMADQAWVRLKAATAGWAPSITARVPAANWYEREVFDMFGVHFDGHPNLTRILMPDDWDGHPLRRDVALGGEPVEFTKDIR